MHKDVNHKTYPWVPAVKMPLHPEKNIPAERKILKNIKLTNLH